VPLAPLICADDARMMVNIMQIKALNGQINQLTQASGRQTTESQPKVPPFTSH